MRVLSADPPIRLIAEGYLWGRFIPLDEGVHPRPTFPGRRRGGPCTTGARQANPPRDARRRYIVLARIPPASHSPATPNSRQPGLRVPDRPWGVGARPSVGGARPPAASLRPPGFEPWPRRRCNPPRNAGPTLVPRRRRLACQSVGAARHLLRAEALAPADRYIRQVEPSCSRCPVRVLKYKVLSIKCSRRPVRVFPRRGVRDTDPRRLGPSGDGLRVTAFG